MIQDETYYISNMEQRGGGILKTELLDYSYIHSGHLSNYGDL